MIRSFGAIPAKSNPLWNLLYPLKGRHYSQYVKKTLELAVIKQREEAKCKEQSSARALLSGGRSTNWVPHPRTGIYFPQGHEQVMKDIPNGAATFRGRATYWLRNVEGVEKAYPETPTDSYLL